MPINMSYCRFQNTLEALRECVDALDEIDYDLKELSSEEGRAAQKLARLCQQFADDVGGEPS